MRAYYVDDSKKIDVLLLDYKLGDIQDDTVSYKIHQLNGVKTFLISAFELEHTVINQLIERRCTVGDMGKSLRMSSMIRELEQI